MPNIWASLEARLSVFVYSFKDNFVTVGPRVTSMNVCVLNPSRA